MYEKTLKNLVYILLRELPASQVEKLLVQAKNGDPRGYLCGYANELVAQALVQRYDQKLKELDKEFIKAAEEIRNLLESMGRPLYSGSKFNFTHQVTLTCSPSGQFGPTGYKIEQNLDESFSNFTRRILKTITGK